MKSNAFVPGTGFQGTSQDDQLSGQGIFHLLGNAFKHALSTMEERNYDVDRDRDGQGVTYSSETMANGTKNGCFSFLAALIQSMIKLYSNMIQKYIT